MSEKSIDKKEVEASEFDKESHVSPLDLIKLHGGKAHKVRGMAGRGIDSMIAIYKDRFTYTFISNREVASIHFDNKSKKIFYSGHNINNMNLSVAQHTELHNVINILENDDEARKFKDAYQATLGHYLADNK